MPWIEKNIMSQRTEFIALVHTGQFKFKNLCKRFGISRTTGYKWFNRVAKGGSLEVLKDQNRRPKISPNQTPSVTEEAFINLRNTYPYWGARKLKVLFKEHHPSLSVPSERTVHRILFRNHLLMESSPRGKAYKRFEHENPNDLWQMDYKGEFPIFKGIYCYPLTVLDDHSRFNLVLDAHKRAIGENIKTSLTKTFRAHGLPLSMVMDRGATWYANAEKRHHWTKITIWLMRLGIRVIHSAYRHPQTCGKDERFHRTLQYDLLHRTHFESFEDVQCQFDKFRYEYNNIRPHDAIGLLRPSDRYSFSPRIFPEVLPPIEYEEGAVTKKVDTWGKIYYRNHEWPISKALEGEYVQVKEDKDVAKIYYVNTLVKTINLKDKITIDEV